MKADDAAKIIEAMADSIEHRPDQFHFELRVMNVGMMGTGGPGGPGIVGVSQGGGIGVASVASSGGGVHVDVNAVADQTWKAASSDMTMTLRDLASAVRSNDAEKATGLLDRLSRLNIVPALVVSVANAVTAISGISV